MFKVKFDLKTPDFRILLGILVGSVMIRCSLNGVNLGGTSGNFPNDPIPSGTLAAQGTFTGQNSQTASGTAAIYVNGTTATLRLGNLSVPSESGLQAQVLTSTSSSPVCTVTLSYYSGTKNYSCPAATGGTYVNVNIRSTAKQLDYAVAQLQ